MIPDGQNELRKLQLRELAVLNGTLRPEVTYYICHRDVVKNANKRKKIYYKIMLIFKKIKNVGNRNYGLYKIYFRM